MNKIIPLFHMSVGDVLRIGLMGVFVVICIALAIIILMQESKQNGLSGTISGAADSYWGKNKGRSMEGKLVKITKILVIKYRLRYKMPPAEHEKRGSESDGVLIIKTSSA